ncbi:hypothetical protein A6770_35045 [Nostoc minutum NIES-26]|uniref:Uncharacterized protein n=1 Tax=Nostoc minutum NIES-26 TaxID=1844469 RepID=A0A367S0U8_9NOSO|nr:hypothetical protein A6770_35045 [Nostoc minutum NIES-26]
MPRKPKAVPLSKVEDIQASLKQKAATPKTISLEELVFSLAKPIQDMLDAGYSYEDVAEVFNGHGVELAASGIKSFHKKVRATTASNDSNESEIASTDSSNSSSDSTSDELSSSPVESYVSESSLSDAGEPLSDSSSKTTKARKAAAKTHGQFNVTDRSDL